jgi:hypothetical protein
MAALPLIDAKIAALSAQPQPEAAYTLDQVVSLFYKNHRGEIALRSFVPKSVRFGSTEWHPEPQWLLLAWDADKRADREFALKDFGPQPDAVEAVKELATRERFSQAALARIRKVRDEYANQAKFADVEPASYLREFIRRLDRAVDQKQSSPPWNGGAAPPLAPDARLRRALERIRDDGPDHGVRWCRNIASEALRADEGKESEGGCMADFSPGDPANLQELMSGASPSDPTPAEQREAIAQWPDGCRNPNSCSIHRDCMYLQCKHYERDISGEVDAALSIRAGG